MKKIEIELISDARKMSFLEESTEDADRKKKQLAIQLSRSMSTLQEIESCTRVRCSNTTEIMDEIRDAPIDWPIFSDQSLAGDLKTGQSEGPIRCHKARQIH